MQIEPRRQQLHPCVLDAVNKHAGAPVLAFGAHETTTPFQDPGASSPTPPLRTPHRLATAKSRRSRGTRMFYSPLVRTRIICLCSSHSGACLAVSSCKTASHSLPVKCATRSQLEFVSMSFANRSGFEKGPLLVSSACLIRVSFGSRGN